MQSLEYPNLSRLLNNDELWESVKDFDQLSLKSKLSLPEKENNSESVEISGRLHQLAFEHFYLMLVFRFKSKEIGRGIFAASADNNYVVLFNLARAFMEHTASLAYQGEALNKAIKSISGMQIADQIRDSFSKSLSVTQQLYYGGEGSPTQIKRLHVHLLLKSLDKIYPNAKQKYDLLCEFVHPNYKSNTFVSSGKIASGEIGAGTDSLISEKKLVKEIIEKCAAKDSELIFRGTHDLVQIDSWIKIASSGKSKFSQIFSPRTGYTGDGKSQETAIYFAKGRTYFEQMGAFHKYLENEGLKMLTRQMATLDNGFLIDRVEKNRGTLWVKFNMSN
jgi:hypothetical protein